MKSLVHLSSSLVRLDADRPVSLCANPDDGTIYAASIEPDSNAAEVWSITFSSANQHESRVLALLSPESGADQAGSNPRQTIDIVDLKALPESF